MRLYDSGKVKAIINLTGEKDGAPVNIPVTFEYKRVGRKDMQEFTQKEMANQFYDIDITDKVLNFLPFKDIDGALVEFSQDILSELLQDLAAFKAIYLGFVTANLEGPKKT